MEKCQNFRLFDIFWDINILDKKKGNLGQEQKIEELLFLQGKIGTIALDFPRKRQFSSVLALILYVSVPNIWLLVHIKFIFLERIIVGLFTSKVS